MAVTNLDIISRGPYAGGKSFGEAGPYEYIQGTIHFAVDPGHQANRRIADLQGAPTGPDGKVHFSSDFYLLQPQTRPQAGRLFYEVLNRGKKLVPAHFNWGSSNPLPDGQPDPGDGFLMRHGFSVVWNGWQVDVPPGFGQMQMQAPAAFGADGRPVSGQTFVQYQPVSLVRSIMLSDRAHKPLPAVDLDDQSATLLVRDNPDAEARVIPRDQWQFARDENGKPVPDSRYCYLAGGFQPGLVYEVIYTTSNWPVVGLAFASTRDTVSFLRYGTAAEGNPAAGSIGHALGFGASMSGRYLREMLWLGMNEDEEGRMVFDGLNIHTGSSRRGEFNIRFGQPSTNASRAPGNTFPFAYETQTDPVTGESGGILTQLRPERRPKIMATNSGIEYWWSGTSLTHAALDGSRDIDPPANVRIYYLTGAQHGPGTLALKDTDETGYRTGNLQNPLDYTPILRAALLNLDRWVREGVEPPSSQYPRVDNGTAAKRESLKPVFEKIPGAKFPNPIAARTRLDYGPGLAEGVPAFPPKEGAPYTLIASAVDADGNELAGVRLPDVTVPLGTYTGWNTRHADVGGEGQHVVSGPLLGSVFPFPRTAQDRAGAGDPRPSIDERYISREDYVSKVEAAAKALIADGYILAEDLLAILDQAGKRYDLFRKG